MQDTTLGPQQVNTMLQNFFGNEAFFRGVQELISAEDEEGLDDDCTVYKNAMLVTLAYFCRNTLLTQQMDRNLVPLQKLKELHRSIVDDINLVQPLSADLLLGYKEEEDDLFFEVAVGDDAIQALKKVARRRLLALWSDRELQACKMIAEELTGMLEPEAATQLQQ